MIENR